jgi:glycerol uptake facilitator-like aquaporin
VPSAAQRVAAEFGGTAFLLAVIVGSGIMAQRLSAGNVAIALLANSIATGAGLYALVATLQPWGPHFNPAVTLLAAWRRQVGARLALACIVAQFAGAFLGVLTSHAMFSELLLQASTTDRTGWALFFSEFVATLGLLAVVSLVPRRGVAAAVAAYIAAAYWFTASTSFANPAVTVARALTDTFTGLGWPAVPGFVGGQLVAVLVAGTASNIARRPTAERGHRKS